MRARPCSHQILVQEPVKQVFASFLFRREPSRVIGIGGQSTLHGNANVLVFDLNLVGNFHTLLFERLGIFWIVTEVVVKIDAAAGGR